MIRGEVRSSTCAGRFEYEGMCKPGADLRPCAPDSLAEFALERGTGFFMRGEKAFLFRAWHPPWQQTDIEVSIKEDSLIAARFPWFKQARFADANFAPGFERVWLGRAHRLDKVSALKPKRRALSSFYEMP